MLDWLADNLALIMFVSMFFFIFIGYPVAFIMGGLALVFARRRLVARRRSTLIGLSDIVLRMWGGVANDPVLASIPMFIFMGAILERSGSAKDMLDATEVLLKRCPGALAVSVMVMGTILAAPIGVVGAAVITLSVIALPQMLAAGYDKRLAIGTIASAGTLGILIPPAIMLVVMAEMLATSAGNLFLAAIMPGFLLSGLYLVYIIARRDLQAGRRAQAAARLRAADPRRVLVRAVARPVPHDGAAGGRARLDLRRLGDADRERRRRRARLHVHRRAEQAPDHQDDERGDLLLLPRQRPGVPDLPRRDRLLLRVPRARRRRSDDLDAGLFRHRHQVGDAAFIMVLIFLLGFPFEWIEICLIVLPVFGPILAKFDFSDHIGNKAALMTWFGTLVAVNLQTAFMTPPFGATLFYMKGTAPPGVTMSDVFRAMYPFVALQVLGLVLCIYFPSISLWLPRLAGFLE